MNGTKMDPPIDFDEIKTTWYYKLVDRFMSDDEKISFIMTGLLNFMHLLSLTPFSRNSLLDGGMIIKIKTKQHIVLAGMDRYTPHSLPNLPPAKLGVMYRKRRPWLSDWQEVELPEDICQLIDGAKDRKRGAMLLSKVLKMQGFW